MKHLIACSAIIMALSIVPALSQNVPAPEVTLPPDGELPLGEATNFVFIAPILGGLLAVGALAGGSASSTTSTVSTN